MKLLTRTKAFFQLIRWNNLTIIIISQLLIRLFIIGGHSSSLIYDVSFFMLVFSTVMVAAGGYIINDYFDIKIDAINKPNKLIVGRHISRRSALAWHGVITFIGCGASFYNGYAIGLLHVLCAFILWLYSRKLKKIAFAGNFSISFLSALPIMMVALLYRDHYTVIFMYTLMAFYISMIREIIKDIEDMKGDASFGCRTLPIIWGVRKTVQMVSALLLVLIFNLFIFFPQFNIFLIFYLLLFVTIPLFYLYVKINKADTGKDFKLLSFYCKLIMVSGIGSVVCFGL